MAKIKVAQCWDDGVYNDIRITDILRKYNAKATFNLNPGLLGETRTPSSWARFGETDWGYHGFRVGKLGKRDLCEIYDGFQVASHCWRHESAGDAPDDVFFKAAMDARKYLEDLFQRPCHGFAWPNGKATPHTADMLRDAGFEYGRTTQYATNVLSYTHPMMLNSSCHFQDRGFYHLYQAAKETSGVFYFWGHSYELLEYDQLWNQYEQQIKFISEDPDAEWIDVIDIVHLPRN